MAIWDETKNNGRFDTSDPATFSAESKKCPNCGSNLFFDTEHSALMCGNCGGTFDPETMDSTGSFALANPEKNYDGKIEMSEDDKRRQEIVCNSCGAQIVTDMNTAATFCSFCGSPAIVTRRLTREFKPDYIIPFAFDKEKAISLFKEHCAGIAHLPKNYAGDEVLAKMTGLYVPTWIISSEVDINLQGVASMGKATDHAYSEGEAMSDNYKQRVFCKVKFRIKDVPFDGEAKVPDRLMAAAEPFDFKDLVPFRAEYLQGYFAEKYDEQPLDMTDKIYRRLDKYALEMCGKLDFGYDAFQPRSNGSHTRYHNQQIKYALLPIWFLTVEYKGLRYQYIVNGQTGKVSGDFPYAKGWETVDRTKKRAKMKTVTFNSVLRGILYSLPMTLLLFGGLIFHYKVMNYCLEHPFEALCIGLLIGLVLYFLSVQLPKILLGMEKKSVDNLQETNAHELDKEQNVLEYFDTAYPMEAYETTFDFVRLDSGWSYGEKKQFDYMTAKPEAETYDDSDSTDFEKKGHDRRMMQ
ncbi:MAG: TFIIB-type zinc ribbon-containing protein [Oscillospiraceae bacterium]|nr:TFIIB-type zinc ribbon-containing protein [Oscillospiraceae bacterium]